MTHKHNWFGKKHTNETKQKMSESASKRIERDGLTMSYKGKYTPINKEKYAGDWTNVIYRSLWERKVMKYLDLSPNVLEWSSEETRVPYIGQDSKRHLYFPDFVAKIEKADGTIETVMIEVKPFKETQPPSLTKDGRKTRAVYIAEMIFIKNQLKWEAARKVCEENGWRFQILTENELNTTKPRRTKPK